MVKLQNNVGGSRVVYCKEKNVACHKFAWFCTICFCLGKPKHLFFFLLWKKLRGVGAVKQHKNVLAFGTPSKANEKRVGFMALKILAFSGSVRKESFNERILSYAIEGAKEGGALVTKIGLDDYPLPLFNQDMEESEGLPQNVLELKKLFLAHDALLIATPEYNSSITPLLKNVIDWVSRDAEGEKGPLACFKGKYAALISASPGYFGGMRSLVELRRILQNIGVTVLAANKSVPKAHEVLADQEALNKTILALKKVGEGLASLPR